MTAVRPDSFEAFHGQPVAIDQLKVAVKSAVRRKAVFGHTLITGSPGLGKTTLATSVLPFELGVTVRSLVCSAISEPKEFLPVITTMKPGELLFLDEIHALPRECFEVLYSVLEDSKLTIVLGDDKNKQAIELALEPFTIVGATTRAGMIPIPLVDRFKHHLKLDLYSDAEMAEILSWTASRLDVAFAPTCADLLVPACHGTARHAGKFIEACIDSLYASDAADPKLIDQSTVTATLKRLQYASNGLSRSEVQLLERLADASGAVGLNTLSSVLDEDSDTVSSIYEPWLLRQSLIEKTPSGRKITPKGRQALKDAVWT